jgi:hypothetical protein
MRVSIDNVLSTNWFQSNLKQLWYLFFFTLGSKKHFDISYLKMTVCVCVCVCPAACRRTHTSHHPKIWHGLLISPGLGNEPGGNPKCWPPGVPPIVTPSEKPCRVKNWAGASKQKLLLGVGLDSKILFMGAHPNLGPAGPLDQSARDYITMKLWHSPGQRRVAHACNLYFENHSKMEDFSINDLNIL